jgi:hypothetical protein
MTRDQDIERVLDRWFTEGPTQMPSRFFDETLDRIDRIPPERLVGLRTRLSAMNPILRFAAAAVVLAVAGLGAVALTQTAGVGNSPPTGSGLVPAALQAEWSPTGHPRQYAFLHGTTEGFADGLDIIVSQSTITIYEPHMDVLASASLVGPDRLELRSLNTGAYSTCQVGDPGMYTFRLSSANGTLTLTPISDACAERATVLAGDWNRTDLGDLAPGRRLLGPGDGRTGGLVSYVVPPGWAYTNVTEPFAIVPRSNAREQADIRLWMDAAPESWDAACATTKPGLERTPATVAAWLATLPGLVVTPPTAVRIGGQAGVMVDVSVAPGWTSSCAPEPSIGPDGSLGRSAEGSVVTTFTRSYPYPVPHPALTVDPGRRVRYLLLDRGKAQVMVIELAAPVRATWDAVVADAMSIVQSFEFPR